VSSASGPAIIFIASVGYSGSTLLDMLLGSNEAVISLGEVYILSRYARENAECTCGLPVRECAFWDAVQSALRRRLERPSLVLSEFPLTLEAPLHTLHRKVPTANDILLVAGSARAWRAGARFSQTTRAYVQASTNAHTLFREVAALTGASTIVDSSKYAVPMKALYLGAPGRVKIVHLVRDGRATCFSLMDRHGMSFDEAARTWRRYNWNLLLMLRTVPQRRRTLIRYEELCRNPAGVLETISELTGSEARYSVRPLDKARFHNIGGNPMRFRRAEVDIVLDERWRQRLTPDYAASFEKLAGDMNRTFGYE
jgi:hypothetical protein